MCFLSKLFGSAKADRVPSVPQKAENVAPRAPEDLPKTPESPPESVSTFKTITMTDYMMGRDKEFPPTDQERKNAECLLKRVNMLLEKANIEREVSSGYRPDHYNVDAGGAATSVHLTCEGVDLADADDKLKNWILKNPKILDDLDLTMEAPRYTDTWVHLQTKRAKSGRRIYIPY